MEQYRIIKTINMENINVIWAYNDKFKYLLKELLLDTTLRNLMGIDIYFQVGHSYELLNSRHGRGVGKKFRLMGGYINRGGTSVEDLGFTDHLATICKCLYYPIQKIQINWYTNKIVYSENKIYKLKDNIKYNN